MLSESINKTDIFQYVEEGRRELARRHLIDFIRYTFPDYKAGWFHRSVCAKLEKFFDNLEKGKRPRLILQAPPRHGKTEIVSVRFPAWALGKNPDLQFIGCSYGSDLAERNSRFVQNLIESSSYQSVFPGLTLGTSRADMWDICGHRGIFRAGGIGTSISGFGADCLIIDDYVKDWQEAESPTVQQRNIDWFRSTAYPRLSPLGGVLVMGTRWHLQDLIGMILETAKETDEIWEVISYPAVAEFDEDHRKAGNALDPVRYPIEILNDIKRNVGDAWLPLYQQRPQPTEGRCYFLNENDDPKDKALLRIEANIIAPKRGFLESVETEQRWKFIEDEYGPLRIQENPLRGFCYAVGLDMSEDIEIGDTGETDDTSISILRRGITDDVLQELCMRPRVGVGDPFRPAFVADWLGKISIDEAAFLLKELCNWYNLAHVLIELNHPGIGVVDIFKKIYDRNRILRDTTLGEIGDSETKKLGLRMDINKPALMADLKAAIRDDKFDEFSAEAAFQYRHFVIKSGKLGAESRHKDDIVISRVLAWRAHLKAPMSRPGNLHILPPESRKVPRRSRPKDKITGY